MDKDSGVSISESIDIQETIKSEKTAENAEAASDLTNIPIDAEQDSAEGHRPVAGDPLKNPSPKDDNPNDLTNEIEADEFEDIQFDWEDEEIPDAGDSRKRKRRIIVFLLVFLTIAAISVISWIIFYKENSSFPSIDPLGASHDSREKKRSEFNTISPVQKKIPLETPTEESRPGDIPNVPERAVGDIPLTSAFREKMGEISELRSQLLKKQNQIRDLQRDYTDQIHMVEKEILREKQTAGADTFADAIKLKTIEYGLRTIQRRRIYINKLNIPCNQLDLAGEELLYLNRLSELQLKMRSAVKGIDLESLLKRINRTLEKHRDGFKRLAVKTESLPSLDLKATWKGVLRNSNTETRLSKSRQHEALHQDQLKTNTEILEELKKGDYSRKRHLTWLSPEGAEALSNWTGKVLYLNGLSNLHPLAAEKLSRWQGNWLCLNGLREIPPKTAKHLAQWPGKRLSFSGPTFSL